MCWRNRSCTQLRSLPGILNEEISMSRGILSSCIRTVGSARNISFMMRSSGCIWVWNICYVMSAATRRDSDSTRITIAWRCTTKYRIISVQTRTASLRNLSHFGQQSNCVYTRLKFITIIQARKSMGNSYVVSSTRERLTMHSTFRSKIMKGSICMSSF